MAKFVKVGNALMNIDAVKFVQRIESGNIFSLDFHFSDTHNMQIEFSNSDEREAFVREFIKRACQ
jgi:hypothetical protein